jgi:heme-degrading monooxygenase HmoA
MVTVVTRVRIKDGHEAEWDEVFAKRIEAARDQRGFELVQLCQPDGDLSDRVILGTWQTHEDWKSWHDDPAFLETREELEEIDQESGGSQWYEVVVEERR